MRNKNFVREATLAASHGIEEVEKELYASTAVLLLFLTVAADEAREACAAISTDRPLYKMRLKKYTRELAAVCSQFAEKTHQLYGSEEIEEIMDGDIQGFRDKLAKEEMQIKMAISNYYLKARHPKEKAATHLVFAMKAAEVCQLFIQGTERRLASMGLPYKYAWQRNLADGFRNHTLKTSCELDKVVNFQTDEKVGKVFTDSVLAWVRRVMNDKRVYE